MCGRYYFQLEDTKSFQRLKAKIQAQAIFEFASDEVFPSNASLVLVAGDDSYALDVMSWGIHTSHGTSLINARSETIFEKKTFQSMVHKRCLIPCNGFFEWKRNGRAHKQKVFITSKDAPLCYLGGIYNDEHQFVIVTAQAQGEMKSIHDRVPLLLQESQIESYLNEEVSFDLPQPNLEFHKEELTHTQEQLDLFTTENYDEKV